MGQLITKTTTKKQTMSTTKNNPLEAMLKQYENSTSSTSNSTAKKEYNLNNYFTTHLPDKVKTATKTIRLLPGVDGGTPFIEFYGHKTKVDGQSKVFACLKHEKNEDCPFCEARGELLATGKEQDKETAKKYSARKYYIPKLIDRDLEDDGVKFWRFPHDYRKQGILDKLFGILQAIKKDITDPQTGRDLQVLLARDQNNYPIVQSITQLDPSPLSTDPAKAAEWLADKRTWEDVYSVKPYEYLEIIVKGGTPVWDKVNNKFVDKSSLEPEENAKLDQELTLGVSNVKNTVTAAATTKVTPTSTPAPAAEEDETDDLPF